MNTMLLFVRGGGALVVLAGFFVVPRAYGSIGLSTGGELQLYYNLTTAPYGGNTYGTGGGFYGALQPWSLVVRTILVTRT